MPKIQKRRGDKPTVQIDPKSVPSAKGHAPTSPLGRPGFKPGKPLPKGRRPKTDTMVVELRDLIAQLRAIM